MLSPTLLFTVMDDIFRELHNKVKEDKLGYRKLKIVKLTECAFIDVLTICAEHEEKCQQNIEM